MTKAKYEPVMIASAIRGVLMILAGLGVVIAQEDVDTIVMAVPAVAAVVDATISWFSRRKTASKAYLADADAWTVYF